MNVLYVPVLMIQSYAPDARPNEKKFLKIKRHVKASTAMSPILPLASQTLREIYKWKSA